MREEESSRRSSETTRRRILAAAASRFARASYEEVKLRDIAADVGVDVALVHRAFGSKEQLFAAAVTQSSPTELLATERAGLGAAFARFALEPQKQQEGLQIFVRSLTSPLARDLLRLCCRRDFIGPLSAKLGGPAAPKRSALLVGCLVGVSILREVLEVEELRDASDADSRRLIERIVAVCLADEDDGCPPPE